MDTIRATNLRKSLYQTLESVAKTGRAVEVILHGRPVATISPRTGGKHKPPIDLDEISSFCKKHNVRALALFGSILTDDFDEKSDVDVLVDVESPSDFHAWCKMTWELEDMFGREVDLVPTSALTTMNRHRRSSITASAREIYRAKAT